VENIEQELNPATLEQTNSEPVNSKEDHQQPRTEAEAQALFNQFVKDIAAESGNKTPVVAKQSEPKASTVTESPETTKAADEQANSAPSNQTQLADPLSFLNDVPENIREKIKSQVEDLATKAKKAQILEQQRRSDDGRVAAYQRHYESERRKRQELELQLANTSRPVVNPPNRTSVPVSSSLTSQQLNQNYLESAEFKELREADPRLAKAIEDRIQQREQALLEQVDRLIQERVQPAHQQLQELYQQQEIESQNQHLSVLDQEAPNWREIVYQHDPNTGQPVIDPRTGKQVFSMHWQAFMGSLPENLRRAVIDANTAEEGLVSLQMYENWRTHPSQPWNQTQQSSTASANGSHPSQQLTNSNQSHATSNEADRIAQKRNQDLKRISTTAKNYVPPMSQASQFDVEPNRYTNPEAWEKWSEQNFKLALQAIEKRDMSLYRR